MYLCMHIQCNMRVFSPSCRTVHAVRWSTWAALARWAEHAWVWRSRWSESGDTSRGRCVNEDERTDRCPAASPSPKTTPTTPYRYQRSLCAYMRYVVIGWDFVYFEDRNMTLWTLCVSWLWSEVYKCSAMSCTVLHEWSSSDLHEYISNGLSVSHSHHASGPEAPPLINLLCPCRAVIQGHESLCCWWFPTALHFAGFRLAAFLPGFRMDICEALQRFLFIASSSVPSDAQEEPGDLSRWAGRPQRHVAWGATTADDQTDWCRRKLQEYWRCGIWKSQLEKQGTHSYTNKHFQEQLSWKNLKYENNM